MVHQQKVYDQTFNQVKGNTAAMIDFKVAPKKVSLEQVKDVYGDHYQYQPSLTEKQADKTEGLYGYTVGKGHITFHVTNGYVDALLCLNRRYKRAAPHCEVLFLLIEYIDECHNESQYTSNNND